ncbi:BMP family ABC transporter substrate-binding protein [Streptomyces sp. NPDC048442]|uniref:BMP family ABC transporter substrate-binding protein n=1 Tax=Streptomyces sp. NPDC048442 TaxID=3154823 RepID=UPI0034132C7F
MLKRIRTATFRAATLRTVALASGAVLLATACNASATKSDKAASADGKSFVLVTPDPVAQNAFLKLSVQGIKAVAKTHKGTSKTYESADASARTQNLTAAVNDAPDVVVMVGYEFADLTAQQATSHPDQQFLLVDTCTIKKFPNVTCATFREQEAAFLAGAEAGLLTKSGKVGSVDAEDSPAVHRYSDAFEEGAKKTAASTTASTRYVGGDKPFADSARAKAQANSLISGGVDHVMAAAAGGNYGIFEAVKAKGAYAYGVDANQCPVAKGAVVDNVIKKTDVAIEKGVAAILKGDTGHTISYGLKEDGMSLTGLERGIEQSGCVIAEHTDVIEKVKALREQIVSGKLKIDDPAA